MGVMQRACILVLSLSMWTLAGCAFTGAPPGHVAKEWATAFRELQLTPIFPPREDVQVGDIYIVPVEPGEEEERAFKEKGYLPRGLWVHSLDLNKTISDFYASRADFPATNIRHYVDFISSYSKKATDTERQKLVEDFQRIVDIPVPEHPQPVSPHNLWTGENTSGGTKSNGNVRRLRIVGAPDFMTATFTQGDLSAFFPAKTGTTQGSIQAQATFSEAKSVSVKVPVAESYGLPVSKLLPELLDQQWIPPKDGDSKETSPYDYIGALVKNPRFDEILDENGEPELDENGKPKKAQIVRLRVSTEVYYARVIEVTIHATEEAAAALRAQADELPVDIGKNGEPETEQDGGDGRGRQTGGGSDRRSDDRNGGRRPVDTTDKTDAGKQKWGNFHESSQRRLKARETAQDMHGVSVRVTAVSENRIGIERTFDRPVAIGFRGFDFSVALDPETGKYLGMTLLGVTESRLGRGGLDRVE